MPVAKTVSGWVRAPLLSLVVCLAALASTDFEQARKLYDRTDYEAALNTLSRSSEPDTGARWELAGKCAYQLGDFKKSITYFDKAVAAEPANSSYYNWLGRAWGRRAETSNPFSAPGHASKARQFFEKAVALNGHDREAVNDLFSYYLEAPGFLGGGMDKAGALAERMKTQDPAEYHYALAQIAERRKQYDLAEGQLRRAAELAPRQVGRLVDLAKFLARHGKYNDSENVFTQAARVDPQSRQVLFARAEVYVETGRNLGEAKKLLEQYLQSPLSPNDPPREHARKLLHKANGD